MFGKHEDDRLLRSLARAEPGDVVVTAKLAETLHGLQSKSGEDIWRMGGGELFPQLVRVGLVNKVEVSVIPVLLGEGIALLLATAKRNGRKLTGQKIYGTAIVSLRYGLQPLF
jgi:dihydrofolate reductase